MVPYYFNPSATKLSEMYDQSKRSEKKDTTTRVDAAEDEEAANLLVKWRYIIYMYNTKYKQYLDFIPLTELLTSYRVI